jgi:serine/threonine protein kinase
LVTDVCFSLGGAAFTAAAIACHVRSRRRRSATGARGREQRKLVGPGSGGEPLLSFDGNGDGNGGGGGEVMLPMGAAAEDAGVVAQRLQLASEAAYDPRTGFPANVAAKQLAALNWRTGPGSAAGAAGVVVSLPFTELAEATRNFDLFNSTGSGGSCDVFKGHVFGLQVAVKRLNGGASKWAEEQFSAEMELLAKIAHPNVVTLFAFSTDGPNRCLVLELCTGGALNDRLSCKCKAGQAPQPPLRWQHRVQIALGILQALEFLHGLTPQMIHRQDSCSPPHHSLTPFATHPFPTNRDLKSPNVLLDGAGIARVADFGTVRKGVVQGAGTRVTHVHTANAVGTRGYMAPEYHDHGQLSPRTDVYSFGIIVLELLMGRGAREVVDMLFDDREFFDRMQEYKDPRAGMWPKKAVTALAAVAKGCTEFRPRERAAVRDVLPKVRALLH